MQEGPIYLDSAASEPLHPAARDTLMAALDAGYADVRRLHGPARNARLLLDNARAVVGECLDVPTESVTFTASGTEAVHRGLLGLVAARHERGSGTIIHSAVEHSSVLHAAAWWGGPTTSVPVDRLGRVAPGDVAVAARGAAVAAVQHANHEVGTVQPLEAFDDVEAPVFVDACASMGRLPLPKAPWTALAGSAHKWGGPAGVGVLVVRPGTRWLSPFPDDDRADPRSSGFENVPAALAAAAALQAVVADHAERNAREFALVEQIRAAAAALDDVDVVGDPTRRLPHVVTFSVLYAHGEKLVTELDRLGFGVASGSACTASTLEPSHVLAAMGALTHGNLRVSLTRDTTPDQVAAFCAALPQAVAQARA